MIWSTFRPDQSCTTASKSGTRLVLLLLSHSTLAPRSPLSRPSFCCLIHHSMSNDQEWKYAHIPVMWRTADTTKLQPSERNVQWLQGNDKNCTCVAHIVLWSLHMLQHLGCRHHFTADSSTHFYVILIKFRGGHLQLQGCVHVCKHSTSSCVHKWTQSKTSCIFDAFW